MLLFLLWYLQHPILLQHRSPSLCLTPSLQLHLHPRLPGRCGFSHPAPPVRSGSHPLQSVRMRCQRLPEPFPPKRSLRFQPERLRSSILMGSTPPLHHPAPDFRFLWSYLRYFLFLLLLSVPCWLLWLLPPAVSLSCRLPLLTFLPLLRQRSDLLFFSFWIFSLFFPYETSLPSKPSVWSDLLFSVSGIYFSKKVCSLIVRSVKARWIKLKWTLKFIFSIWFI